jgi:uncharacterized protein YbjT (DUF2867 family)
MFVVTGITGNTGAAAARTLLAHGKAVTAFVRDPRKAAAWEAKGVRLAAGSLEDTAALTKALSGAEGAYLVLPPTSTADDFLADRARLADSMASAVRKSGLRHVVLLSSIGAQHAAGTGPIRALRYAENAICAAADTTVLRAAYFFENFGASIPVAKAQGVLPNFLTPGRKIPMIATADIGRIAAQNLYDPPRGRCVLEIAGPGNCSPEDIAATLTGLLGKPVALQNLPMDDLIPAMTSFGVSANLAALFREMMEGINSGLVAYEGADAPQVRGYVTAKEALQGLLGS